MNDKQKDDLTEAIITLADCINYSVENDDSVELNRAEDLSRKLTSIIIKTIEGWGD